MLLNAAAAIKAWLRFTEYEPQTVTPRKAYRWITQFDKAHHAALRTLLDQVQYITRRSLLENLEETNMALLRDLDAGGVGADNVIYVSINDVGSSSSLLLALLRDRCRLEQLGCQFAQANDRFALHDLTKLVGRGAIIYVDDFAGSGDQFCDERDLLSSTIAGHFSEYFLVHSICEEALGRIAKTYSVEPVACNVHQKTSRPLHYRGTALIPAEKRSMRELCWQIDKSDAFGHKRLAANIVFYRSAPDAIPRVFRGDVGQTNFEGIFPRLDDLPPPKL